MLTEEQIKAAERVLHKGDRVELVPVKEGVRVLRIRREEACKVSAKPPEKPGRGGDFVV